MKFCKNHYELFTELDFEWDDDDYEFGHGTFKGRNVRWLGQTEVIQVGCKSEDFDRWANSVEFEFELYQPKGRRAFLRWINDETP